MVSARGRALRGRLAPEKVFPAGDDRFTVTRLTLRSGLRVRSIACGPAQGLPVVLFPGWACPAYVFRSVLPALCTRGYRGVIVELKGHGLSDKPVDPAEYGTESMVSHVVE